MVPYRKEPRTSAKSFRAKNLKNDQNQIFIFNCINVIQMCPSLVFKNNMLLVSKLHLLTGVCGLPRCPDHSQYQVSHDVELL